MKIHLLYVAFILAAGVIVSSVRAEYLSDSRCVEFQTAALQNEVENVERFLDTGVDVDCIDPVTGETALMQAARNGSVEVVMLLLSSGADVTIRTQSGQTALSIAVKTREALIKGGAAFASLRERIGKAIAALEAVNMVKKPATR
jgi:ankyrin repeat protein